jgi:hypothetical protein
VDDLPLRRFTTVSAYNAAFPAALMPVEPSARHRLRGYHHAMRGVLDDVTQGDTPLTIDFLPGGPPVPGEIDRIGTVVASRWRDAPYVVLADDISLRAAWRAIVRRWPARLSEVRETLAEVVAETEEALNADS